MNVRIRIASSVLYAIAAFSLAAAPFAVAQTRTPAAPAAQMPSEKDVADAQEQFLHLLRLSPTLTAAVAADPSLLADQQYVGRSNPELAQFMTSHPDIARNPEFYLFSRLNPSDGARDQALQRVIWPDLAPAPQQEPTTPKLVENLAPIIIVPCIFLAIVWVIRLFVQNNRWNRAFRQQMEMHGRLIDKFGTSQELIAYLDSEAGKQFLSGSPIAPGPESGPRMPNAVARVLTPLQVGVVMTLLGIGFLFLRHVGSDTREGMTVLGTLVLMPGIGFILSAGATWVLGHRLGLMPKREAPEAGTTTPFGSQDRN
ncbi:MAG: hypothetical protein ACRD3S_10610 [Terracidiphilus sp.]